jgi:hypothetical protein
MKPKFILTFASVLCLLLTFGVAGYALQGGFNFPAYLGVAFAFCLGALFWAARNAPVSNSLDAILLTGFLAFFLGSIIACYGQWSGNYIDSPLGYLEGVAWLAMAIWFHAVRRANRSTSTS